LNYFSIHEQQKGKRSVTAVDWSPFFQNYWCERLGHPFTVSQLTPESGEKIYKALLGLRHLT